MKENLFKDLLRRFFSEKVTPSEYTALRSEVEKATDETLDETFSALWEETQEIPAMDVHIKSDVLSKIEKRVIVPKSRPSFSSWVKYAATILLPLLVTAASFYYFGKNQGEEELFTVFAENGHKTQVFLPDGTKVWLNSDSYLSYSSQFNNQNRTVTLKGEAFFDVTKDQKHSFTVKAGDVNVVVHGTAFNVSAYPDEPTMNVSLLRGAVRVENDKEKSKGVDLKPNQKVQISKNLKDWHLASCNAELECLWTRNMLRFENTPAMEVFHKLEKWYGVDIQVKNLDLSTRYGFVLKTESLREMLDLINKITSINYQIKGEEVTIRYQ